MRNWNEVSQLKLFDLCRLDPTGRDAEGDSRGGQACRRSSQRTVQQRRAHLYRDGRDSVAPHNDHLYDIREGFPIALLSLGATRRMTIRLLIMDYATQIHYTLGVPKTSGAYR
jgi:hypothetical protein